MSEKNQVKWRGVLQARADTSTINQVSVTSTATEIKAANVNRHDITIVNHSTTDIYLGKDNTVTTANGILLPAKGFCVVEGWDGDMYGIVASGTATIGYWEMGT